MNEHEIDLINVLQVILDCVDYTNNACRPNEAVGAVLPQYIVQDAKNIIERIKEESKRDE